jgi:hypothetical protein
VFLGRAFQACESNDPGRRANIPHCPLEFAHQGFIQVFMNIFNPRSWRANIDESINNTTLNFTRIVIAIGVFAVGVELPKKYMYRHWTSLDLEKSLLPPCPSNDMDGLYSIRALLSQMLIKPHVQAGSCQLP